MNTLYKYTQTGAIQQWTIFVKGNTYYTEEGILNGAITRSKPTVCQGKNIGKSNETTPEEQALLEAQAKHQKKLDKGYNEVLTKEKKFFEPMLAFEREKYEKLLFTVPTYVQPKLDGVRCILDEDGSLTTRNGKPIVSCPHLSINGYLLDGELYNHDLKEDFDKIISLTRKSKPTNEDLDESSVKVEYWIYDFPIESKRFSQRYLRLLTLWENGQFPDCFKIVPTYQVLDIEDIEQKHQEFLEQGYEGTMIRLDLGPYEGKRSKQLLKYKNFVDAEFEILDVIEGEGNRSGMAGNLVIKLPNGNTCGVGMTGTQEFMAQVWKDREKVVGLQATVKFFGWTKDGSLRFPTLKHINEYSN